MKKFVSILTALIIFSNLIMTVCASGIETDSSRIRQPYLQIDVTDITKDEGIVLLEYDFVAGDSIGGLYFLSTGDTHRFSPLYTKYENNEIWYESNTYVSPKEYNSQTDAVKPLEKGRRYQVVSVIDLKEKEVSTIDTYINGRLVREKKKTGMRSDTGITSFYSTMRVFKGTISSVEKVEEFDYTPYLVRVSSKSDFIEVSHINDALFEINLKKAYTVENFLSAITLPQGAKASVMHGKNTLSRTSLISNGSRLVVQSKNKKQTIEYAITSPITPFVADRMSVDHTKCEIKNIPSGTTVSELAEMIEMSDGFSIAGAFINSEEIAENYVVADGMSLVVNDGAALIEYALDTESDAVNVLSTDYFISEKDKVIYGVLMGTPVYKLKDSLVLQDGYSVVGVFDGESEIDGKIISNCTLKIASPQGILNYDIFLTPPLLGSRAFDTDGCFLISGSITPATGVYNLSLSDLYSETNGDIVSLESGGSISFWGHRADYKWERGKTYNFEVVTDGADAEADVYINGEKVLNDIYPSWLKSVKTPINVKGNIKDYKITPIYSDGLYDEETKVYNTNCSVKSDRFSISDSEIVFSGKAYTCDEFLSFITPTNGAKIILYDKNGDVVSGESIISEDMYIILQRRNIEKQYDITIKNDGIETIGEVKLYKNEISEKSSLKNMFTLPFICETAGVESRLTYEDKLILEANISNYNKDAENIRFLVSGYDKDGKVIAVSISDGKNVEGLTDGETVLHSIDVSSLRDAQVVKIYLWADNLSPMQIAETLVVPSSIRIDSLLDADETNNDYYREYIDTKNVGGRERAKLIINSALSKPNYKGLIFEENGENDIRLQIRIDENYMPDGKSIENYLMEITIEDGKGVALKKLSEENLSENMSTTLSSGDLGLGDFTIRVSLKDKESGQEEDFNLHPLRKRCGDITELSRYVDEYGRYIKDGKPIFYTAIYGDTYQNTAQLDLFRDNGIDGVQLYWQNPVHDDESITSIYSKEWYDSVCESGMDFWPLFAIFYNSGYDNHFFKLAEEEDEGRVIEKIMSFSKNNEAIGGYYIGDENPLELRDRVDWHNDIISSYDLTKPTLFMDVVGSNTFAHNTSSDIIGFNHYPVRFERDDPDIKMDTLLKRMRDNFINKPVWVALQCVNRGVWYNDGISETAKGEAASEKQLRNMAMQAVTNGFSGLWWYSYNSLLKETGSDKLTNDALIIRNHDEKELLSRPLEVSALFKKWENIIMSVEDTAKIEFSGNNTDYIAKTYDGKTYIFAVNKGMEEQEISFSVDGATKVKNIYTDEPVSFNADGSFSFVLGNIDIAVFEVEHSLFLSDNTNLYNLSLENNGESCTIRYNEDDEMIVYLPKNADEILYSVEIGEKSRLYIDGVEVGLSGTISGDNVVFSIRAESGSENKYSVRFIKE